MFNACRRGPASISRVLRAAASSTRIPSTRPTTLSSSLRSTTRPALDARWLHVSSQWRNQSATARAADQLADDMEEIKRHQSTMKITRFDQLLEYQLVHPNVVETITKDMGHHTMTEVQTATINQALHGTDM
jgi:ATP-dependent RNA helicase MSS116